MTLAQIQTAIQSRGYGTDTATQQLDMINARYRELMSMHRWPFNDATDVSLVTVVGTGSVAIAGIANLEAVNAVRLQFPSTGTPTEQYELTYLAPEEFRSRTFQGGYSQGNVNGIPRWWTQVGGLQAPIQLVPLPDRIYQVGLDYNKGAVDLAAGADIPAFPVKYHDILVWGAIVDIAFRERDYWGTITAQQQYDTRLREFEKKYGIRQQQNPTHVRRSGFWDQVGQGAGGWAR